MFNCKRISAYDHASDLLEEEFSEEIKEDYTSDEWSFLQSLDDYESFQYFCVVDCNDNISVIVTESENVIESYDSLLAFLFSCEKEIAKLKEE